MKFSEYIKYWKDASISNKAIGHLRNPKYMAFKRMNMHDIWTALKLDMHNKTLILENPEFRTNDSLSDNPREILSGAVLMVEEIKLNNDADEIEKMDKLKEITEQLMAKIINDAKKTKQKPKTHPHKIYGIDQNTLQVNKVGPLFGNWHGWRLSFSFNQNFENNLVLKDDEWNSDTAFNYKD